jgi:hypothetical protein
MPRADDPDADAEILTRLGAAFRAKTYLDPDALYGSAYFMVYLWEAFSDLPFERLVEIIERDEGRRFQADTSDPEGYLGLRPGTVLYDLVRKKRG